MDDNVFVDCVDKAKERKRRRKSRREGSSEDDVKTTLDAGAGKNKPAFLSDSPYSACVYLSLEQQ